MVPKRELEMSSRIADGQTTSIAPLVRTQDVTRVYHVGAQEVYALQGVDLAVERGLLVGLMGPSGSGKTTLLNLIGGLDRPTSGEVYFEDQMLNRLSGRDAPARDCDWWDWSAGSTIVRMRCRAASNSG